MAVIKAANSPATQRDETRHRLADLRNGASKALADGHYALAAALSRACDNLAAILRAMDSEDMHIAPDTRMVPLVGFTRDEQPARPGWHKKGCMGAVGAVCICNELPIERTEPVEVTMSHAPNRCATCSTLIMWSSEVDRWVHAHSAPIAHGLHEAVPAE